MKRSIMIWLPIILLPALNMIPVISGHRAYQFFIFPIIGAVVEELIFRGLLLWKWLLYEERIKPVIAIIIVAVLFSLMHLWNLRSGAPFLAVLIQIFFAFCFSIWAGAVVWKTGRITIPLIAHLLLNATAAEDNMWAGIIASIVVLADGIILLQECGKGQVHHQR